jgi:tetratricopeptide (TPR) repeat protein
LFLLKLPQKGQYFALSFSKHKNSVLLNINDLAGSASLSFMKPCFFSLLACLFLVPCPAQVLPPPAPDPGKVEDPAPPPPGLPAPAGEDPDPAGEPKPALSPEGVRAAEAFTKKDWATARSLYEEMLKAEPDTAMILANLGAVEQQAGQPDAARVYLEKAVALNPRLVSSWTLLGLLYHDEGQTYHAISALSRAIHEDPRDAKPHHYLGLVIRGIGWKDGAETELQRALELDPDYAEAHFNLALMYLEEVPPSVELARHHYRQAVRLGMAPDPDMEKHLKAPDPAPPPP